MTNAVQLDQLPEPLPAAQIIALNQPKADLHTARPYEWNGWTFELPPGVFLPGATSRMIHERLLDGTIEVQDRVYAAMGVGLGVETVVAGLRDAAEIYACDVDATSVRTAQRYFDELAAPTSRSTFVAAWPRPCRTGTRLPSRSPCPRARRKCAPARGMPRSRDCWTSSRARR
ncbi:hypothetical protein LZ318_13585 [Saccharopolyspora indica]|uniref:hypothetical protein n=1 Tax=Saccharopolyspora indica TaxID=1229659 RepID=UPI0022EB7B1B|nr:hypothetical protein [Saccharopolyspora indica]MDA3647071.1 hypothetical protein [Saccharopolyspora indica]